MRLLILDRMRLDVIEIMLQMGIRIVEITSRALFGHALIGRILLRILLVRLRIN